MGCDFLLFLHDFFLCHGLVLHLGRHILLVRLGNTVVVDTAEGLGTVAAEGLGIAAEGLGIAAEGLGIAVGGLGMAVGWEAADY